MNSLDSAPRKGIKGVRRDVRLPQHVDVFKEHTGYVKSNISLSNDHGVLPLGEVRGKVGMFGQPVIPAHKFSSRVYALETLLSRNAKFLVSRCTIGKNNGVIIPKQ